MTSLDNRYVCKDNKGHFYTIDSLIYNIKNGTTINPLCIYCSKPLFSKCINNPKRRTHLSHHKNQSCKSVSFQNCFENSLSKTISALEIENRKVLFLLYSNKIYDHINFIYHNHITKHEFCELFKNIPQSIFQMVEFPIESIAYIFINSLKVKDDITYLYTSTDTAEKLWEFCGAKDVLIKIDETNGVNTVTSIATNYTYLDNVSIDITIDFITNTFNTLFRSLNLSAATEDMIIKYLLNFKLTT